MNEKFLFLIVKDKHFYSCPSLNGGFLENENTPTIDSP